MNPANKKFTFMGAKVCPAALHYCSCTVVKLTCTEYKLSSNHLPASMANAGVKVTIAM